MYVTPRLCKCAQVSVGVWIWHPPWNSFLRIILTSGPGILPIVRSSLNFMWHIYRLIHIRITHPPYRKGSENWNIFWPLGDSLLFVKHQWRIFLHIDFYENLKVFLTPRINLWQICLDLPSGLNFLAIANFRRLSSGSVSELPMKSAISVRTILLTKWHGLNF